MDLKEAIEKLHQARIALVDVSDSLSTVYGSLAGDFDQNTGEPLDLEAELQSTAHLVIDELRPIIASIERASGTADTEVVDFDADERAELLGSVMEFKRRRPDE